jgi:hypothetical protein
MTYTDIYIDATADGRDANWRLIVEYPAGSGVTTRYSGTMQHTSAPRALLVALLVGLLEADHCDARVRVWSAETYVTDWAPMAATMARRRKKHADLWALIASFTDATYRKATRSEIEQMMGAEADA